ncbi:hypothetical protein SAMN04487962_1459 [Marinobacter segnicrescens]|uniref:Uncharacterized protein n=1 Tax=Marinobacter segnicrescens TaxID=430453 RepID=A0A1I0I5T5_9GAMM|nr:MULTISPECIES: hypothetical protein [Marinobacter]SET91962.1 hypothetical protein SAMN04487962_1459 [Marinobacter segnicrescens]
MSNHSFVNGFVTIDTLRTHAAACLQAAPIGVNDGEDLLGVVLDPLSYEGLMRLAIVHRQQQSGKEPYQTMSEAMTAFIDMGERLLGEASKSVPDDAHNRNRPHRDPSPDDEQPPS